MYDQVRDINCQGTIMKYVITLFATCFLSSAAFCGITTLSVDPSTLEFKSVKIDQQGVNFTYRVNDIIGFDLTAWNGAALLVGDGDPAPPIGSRAALLDEDLRFDTGVINSAASPTAAQIVFDQPVFNNRGDDILIFEFDNATALDPIQVRINGIDKTYGAADYTGQLFGPLPADVYGITAGNLTQLENNGVSKISDTSQNLFAISINLSDFGIAKTTGSISSIEFGGVGGGENADFVFIAGLKSGNPSVPEPSTGMFLFFGVGLMTFFRRSMATAKREKEAAA
jgi:hypothetical protein